MLQKFETYELKEFQSSVSVTKSCKNFSTNIGVRSLQDFHLTKSLGARNLQDFHLARKVVQETYKIFILQDIWCKKRARFLTCKISNARNLHILQETCKMVQDFFTWDGSFNGDSAQGCLESTDFELINGLLPRVRPILPKGNYHIICNIGTLNK